MEEARDPKPDASTGAGETAKAHDADATSDETLSDVEATEKVSGAKSDSSTGGHESSSSSTTPSPDGAFDGTRSGGTSADGDPM